MRLISLSDAFEYTAATVLPNFKPMTGVGVSCFANSANCSISASVQCFPVLRMYLGGFGNVYVFFVVSPYLLASSEGAESSYPIPLPPRSLHEAPEVSFLFLSTPLLAQGAHHFDTVLVRGNGVAANVVPYATSKSVSPVLGVIVSRRFLAILPWPSLWWRTPRVISRTTRRRGAWTNGSPAPTWV
jgi:hypothetical protein